MTLRLRFGDYSRATRSHTLPQATQQTATVLRTARQLLHDAQPLIAERGCTLIGVAVSGLTDQGTLQLELPLDAHRPALDEALDDLRDRFGAGAVTRAVHLGRDPDFSVPVLPD